MSPRFFIYILILLALHQMGVGLFRLVGVLARTMTIANTAGSFALLCIFLLGGFIIAKRERRIRRILPSCWIAKH